MSFLSYRWVQFGLVLAGLLFLYFAFVFIFTIRLKIPVEIEWEEADEDKLSDRSKSLFERSDGIAAEIGFNPEKRL